MGCWGGPKIERQEYEPSDLVYWYVYARSLASAPLWDLSFSIWEAGMCSVQCQAAQVGGGSAAAAAGDADAGAGVESLSFFVSLVLALTLLTEWLQLETECRTMGGVRLLGLLGGGSSSNELGRDSR